MNNSLGTNIVSPDELGINKAVKLLKSGKVAALPTETVYGLAGNALDVNAITKIFTAKNRPQDNPLIVHVSDMKMVMDLGLEITELAEKLAARFWGGPLTMIFEKNCNIIPNEISCGLDTVAVRVPANEIILEVIKRCGFPIAAPSANLSGSPSPTKASHVYDDLKGRVELIIDGGECKIGIESTVISFDNGKIRVLRPGAVTPEMLSEFAGVIVDKAVFEQASEHVKSPGTAYKHYSPKASVIAVITEDEKDFLDYTQGNMCAIIANPDTKTLFAKFREFDELGVKKIFVRLPEKIGVGLALYNRIVRAAEFNIVDLNK